MPLPAALPLLATTLALALVLGGCGEEDAQLLPGGTAREITANLDTVERLADEGDCLGAESAALQVSEQVEALEGVDPRLERALAAGAARLNEVVARCEEEVETAEPAPAEAEADEGELERAEKEALKEQKEREKEEGKQEEEGEEGDEEGSPALPPQAEGEGKGVEGEGGPPPAGEEGGGTPSGGLSPANPAGEG